MCRELVGKIPREAALKGKGCLKGQRGPEELGVPHRQFPQRTRMAPLSVQEFKKIWQKRKLTSYRAALARTPSSDLKILLSPFVQHL